MSLIGPAGINSSLNSILAEGDPQGMGDDVFSVSTSVISGGRDRDGYHCTASNGASALNDSVELRGHYTPCNIVFWLHDCPHIYLFFSCPRPYYNIITKHISHCCESGVESAIRRSHSDWLCSTLQ